MLTNTSIYSFDIKKQGELTGKLKTNAIVKRRKREETGLRPFQRKHAFRGLKVGK